jgi:hypothetical protein
MDAHRRIRRTKAYHISGDYDSEPLHLHSDRIAGDDKVYSAVRLIALAY